MAMTACTGKIRCVVFDWAGTTMDYGCIAPLNVFLDIFARIDVPITAAEASRPMGMLKIDHIRVLLGEERIAAAYARTHDGRAPDETSVCELYALFEEQLMRTLADYTDPLPGVVDTVRALRAAGIHIGSTSGYTADMVAVIAPLVAAKGYAPDFVITASEVNVGRPAPNMLYANAVHFNVFPMHDVVKVGDTLTDIGEGRNGGAWTVGVLLGSSLLGLTQAQVASLPADELARHKDVARRKYLAAGADYVIDSMSDLPGVIGDIDARLRRHERPGNAQVLPVQPYRLFTPGPIATSRAVKLTMMTDWGSREADYLQLVQSVRRQVSALACPSVSADAAAAVYTTVIVQGSGTFGVEACIGTAVPASGKLLVIVNGQYGKRVSQMARILHIALVELTCDETVTPDLAALDALLVQDAAITHVAVIHSETTTGILNPLAPICAVIKKHGKVCIVDAMSSFGSIPLDMIQLNIDFLVASANKNIQGVPGIAYVIARISELVKCADNRRSLALDLYEQWTYLEKTKGGFRFTSPVHVIRAFDQALAELAAEGGVAARFERYTRMQRRLADGMRALHFRVLELGADQGPIITTFHSPRDPAYDFERFYLALKERGCVIYPGKLTQADTFRIGTIGDITEANIDCLLEQIKEVVFWDNSI